MRYGQRAELRCHKYLRRLRALAIPPVMRQIDALLVLSHQVKEPVPRLKTRSSAGYGPRYRQSGRAKGGILCAAAARRGGLKAKY